MTIREDSSTYARIAAGGPGTAEEKLEAAYIAGASRWPDREDLEAEAKLIVAEVYGPGEPEGWQLDNARAALFAIAERRAGFLTEVPEGVHGPE